MSVRDKIEAGEYKPKMPYPENPKAPRRHAVTSIDHRQCADELEVYEKAMAVYREARKAYGVEEGRLIGVFTQDLFDELGIADHPKRDTLYKLAWEYGHGNGMGEVLNHAENLVDLLDWEERS